MRITRVKTIVLSGVLLTSGFFSLASAQQAAPPADTAATKPAMPDSPAVAAILETKPTKPEDCVRAAKILADLDRPDLAKEFLKKTLDAKLDAAHLAELGERVGSPAFLELSVREGVQPEGKLLADAVMAALAEKLENPRRIAALIAQLENPSPEKRLEAVIGLQAAGESAVAPLAAALVDPARKTWRANVRAALASLGRAARDPLLAIAGGADAELAAEAIDALGAMKDPRIALYLYRPLFSTKSDPGVRAAADAAIRKLTGGLPSRKDAVRSLADAARAFRDGHYRAEDLVATRKPTLWRWEAERGQCKAVPCTVDDMARDAAARLARDAYELAPKDRELGLMYVAAALEAVGCDGQTDFPKFEEKWSTPESLGAVLDYATARGQMKAAVLAAERMGQLGRAEELLQGGARPAPLVEALQSPDRRLQMAAIESIVRLKPDKLFAGASLVPQRLAFLAGSVGSRRALVACPHLEHARNLAGLLTAAGFIVETASNGRALLFEAARSPDYELAMIDMTIDRPTADLLLQQLRHDPRTASLRVGLIAREGAFDRAERIAGRDPLAKAFSRPTDAAALQWQLEQLSALEPGKFVDFKARQRQAARALELLAELAESPEKLYDLRVALEPAVVALYNPRLSAKASAVLAGLNAPESQRALVELALRAGQPLFERQEAARAFRKNTERFGVLLTNDEIRRLQHRLETLERDDADSRTILGLILECVRARRVS